MGNQTRVFDISDVPNVPAVYAMYGGEDPNLYIAYVGITTSLKDRISQHLIRRDSSVATGTSATCLNPDYVTKLEWWVYPEFNNEATLQAAVLVAFEVFEPALRSRGNISSKAKNIYADTKFREKMRNLFSSEPAGSISFPSLQNAWSRINELEERIILLEKRLNEK